MESYISDSQWAAFRATLLDLTGRNPLLNYQSTASNSWTFSSAEPQNIFYQAIRKNLPGVLYPRQDNGLEPWPYPHFPLQTNHNIEEIHQRVNRIRFRARTIREERGVQGLYLALGMVTWLDAEEEKHAPLLLIPVRFELPHQAKEMGLVYTGGKIQLNRSLHLLLEQEHQLRIPDVIVNQQFSPDIYFSTVSATVSPLGWRVNAESAVLGFFLFSRLSIYRDLDPAMWPPHRHPTDHPVINTLLSSGQVNPPPPVPPATAHSSQTLIFDSDYSQLQALAKVAKGHHMVIQGPPGTGKSQTIANLIGHAIDQGQKVLFVAEKMAALDVVRQRLANIGLAPQLLELHDYQTTRSSFVQDLKQAMTLGEPQNQGDFAGEAEYHLLQQELDMLAWAMNTPVERTHLTPYDLFGRLIGQTKPAELLTGIEQLNYDEIIKNIKSVEALFAQIGPPASHPFDINHDFDLPVSTSAKKAGRFLQLLQTAIQEICNSLKVDLPSTVEEGQEQLSLLRHIAFSPAIVGQTLHDERWHNRWAEIEEALSAGYQRNLQHSQLANQLLPEAWQLDWDFPQTQYQLAREKILHRFSPEYRQADMQLASVSRQNLPRSSQKKLTIVTEIIEFQRLETQVEKMWPILKSLFDVHWQGWESDWEKLLAIGRTHHFLSQSKKYPQMIRRLAEGLSMEDLAVLKRLTAAAWESWEQFEGAFQPLSDSLGVKKWVRLSITQLLEKLSSLANNPAIIEPYQEFSGLLQELEQKNLAPLTHLIREWNPKQPSLTAQVESHLAHALLHKVLKDRPILYEFDPQAHQVKIDRFRKLDVAAVRAARKRLAYQHWKHLPEPVEFGQVGIVVEAINRQRGGKSVRELLQQAGQAIQKIKPVFMMSPLSVATYLQPAALDFDLVIFDEASQIRPGDALGAILRGRQIVVVGDSQQLPPTPFFEKSTAAEHDDAPLESILDLFVASGFPQITLRWHYRSQHESLIALSNALFYQNQLVPFPSPMTNRSNIGLSQVHLPDTVYERAGSRTNPLEAAAVAAAAVKHMREYPHFTLGIATFNLPQRHRIAKMIEAMQADEPHIKRFIASHPHEPFFIKNLENVQGDERDVMLISVGYGRDQSGQISQNFGPLNTGGGERRLNVLITRARRQCVIFSNLQAEDLDLSKSTSAGIHALKQLLRLATDGSLPETSSEVTVQADPFSTYIKGQLISAGYDITERVGLGGIEVDLAVGHPDQPGRYQWAIEFDGRDYARAANTSERDRLQQAVLGQMGWPITRVWAAGWFFDPENHEKTLLKTLKQSKKKFQPFLLTPDSEKISRLRFLKPYPTPLTTPYPYIDETSIVDWRAASYRELLDTIERLIEIEGPLAKNVIIKRFEPLLSKLRNFSPRYHSSSSILTALEKRKSLVNRGGFLWSSSMNSVPLRNRKNVPGILRDIIYVPPEELSDLFLRIIDQSSGMSLEELWDETHRHLGILHSAHRQGMWLDPLFELFESGQLILRDGHVLQTGIFPQPPLLNSKSKLLKRIRAKLTLSSTKSRAQTKVSYAARTVLKSLYEGRTQIFEAGARFQLDQLVMERWHRVSKYFYSKMVYPLTANSDYRFATAGDAFVPDQEDITYYAQQALPPGELFAALRSELPFRDTAKNILVINQLFFRPQNSRQLIHALTLNDDKRVFLVSEASGDWWEKSAQKQKIMLWPFDPSTGCILSDQPVPFHSKNHNFYSSISPPENTYLTPKQTAAVIGQPQITRSLIVQLHQIVLNRLERVGPVDKENLIADLLPTFQAFDSIRVREWLEEYLDVGFQGKFIGQNRNFIYLLKSPIPIRNRQYLPENSPLRRLEAVSDVEIAAAIDLVTEMRPDLSPDKMPSEVARILGTTKNSPRRVERILHLAQHRAYQPDSNFELSPYPQPTAPYPFSRRQGWMLFDDGFIGDELYIWQPKKNRFGGSSGLKRHRIRLAHPQKLPDVGPGRLLGRLAYMPNSGRFYVRELFFQPRSEFEQTNPILYHVLSITSRQKCQIALEATIPPKLIVHDGWAVSATFTAQTLNFVTGQKIGKPLSGVWQQKRTQIEKRPWDDSFYGHSSPVRVSTELAAAMADQDKRWIKDNLAIRGPIQPKNLPKQPWFEISDLFYLSFCKRILAEGTAEEEFQKENGFYWLSDQKITPKSRKKLPEKDPRRSLESISDPEILAGFHLLKEKRPDSSPADRPRQLLSLMSPQTLSKKRRKRLNTLWQQIEPIEFQTAPESKPGRSTRPYQIATPLFDFFDRSGWLWQERRRAFVSKNLYRYHWRGKYFSHQNPTKDAQLVNFDSSKHSLANGFLAAKIIYDLFQREYLIDGLYYVVDNPENGEKLALRVTFIKPIPDCYLVQDISYELVERGQRLQILKLQPFDPLHRELKGETITEKRVAPGRFLSINIMPPHTSGDEPKPYLTSVDKIIDQTMGDLDIQWVSHFIEFEGPIERSILLRRCLRHISNLPHAQFRPFLQKILGAGVKLSRFVADSQQKFYFRPEKPINIRDRSTFSQDHPLRQIWNVSDQELIMAVEQVLQENPKIAVDKIPDQILILLGLDQLDEDERDLILFTAHQMMGTSPIPTQTANLPIHPKTIPYSFMEDQPVEREGWDFDIKRGEFTSQAIYLIDREKNLARGSDKYKRPLSTRLYQPGDPLTSGGFYASLRYHLLPRIYEIDQLYYIADRDLIGGATVLTGILATNLPEPGRYALIASAEISQGGSHGLVQQLTMFPFYNGQANFRIKAARPVQELQSDSTAKIYPLQPTEKNRFPAQVQVDEALHQEMGKLDRLWLFEILKHEAPIRFTTLLHDRASKMWPGRVLPSKTDLEKWLNYLLHEFRKGDSQGLIDSQAFIILKDAPVPVRSRAHLPANSIYRHFNTQIHDRELFEAIMILLQDNPDLPTVNIPQRVFDLFGLASRPSRKDIQRIMVQYGFAKKAEERGRAMIRAYHVARLPDPDLCFEREGWVWKKQAKLFQSKDFYLFNPQNNRFTTHQLPLTSMTPRAFTLKHLPQGKILARPYYDPLKRIYFVIDGVFLKDHPEYFNGNQIVYPVAYDPTERLFDIAYHYEPPQAGRNNFWQEMTLFTIDLDTGHLDGRPKEITRYGSKTLGENEFVLPPEYQAIDYEVYAFDVDQKIKEGMLNAELRWLDTIIRHEGPIRRKVIYNRLKPSLDKMDSENNLPSRHVLIADLLRAGEKSGRYLVEYGKDHNNPFYHPADLRVFPRKRSDLPQKYDHLTKIEAISDSELRALLNYLVPIFKVSDTIIDELVSRLQVDYPTENQKKRLVNLMTQLE